MFLNAGDVIARRDGRSFILTADVFFPRWSRSGTLSLFGKVPLGASFIYFHLFIYCNATKRLSKTERVNRPLHLRRIRERGGGECGRGFDKRSQAIRLSMFVFKVQQQERRRFCARPPRTDSLYFSHQSGGGGGTSIGAELRQD